MDSLSSPTYSINQGALKLNLSENASSSLEANLSDAKGPIVMFEQYINENNKPKAIHAKKCLKISIDSGSFNFQSHDHEHEVEYKPLGQMQFTSEREEGRMSASYNSKEEKPRFSDGKIRELQKLLQKSDAQKCQIEKQNENLKAQLKKKEEIIQSKQQKNDELIYKIAQLEQMNAKDHFYDEKLRQKEAKIKEMQKLYEKVVTMNKSLQKQLKESDKMIFELQKQLQKSICHTQQQNLTKIKQSSTKLKESSIKLKQSTGLLNKQNNSLINGMKSLDRKKTSSSQIKKTGRVVSSSGNIAKKLQINKL